MNYGNLTPEELNKELSDTEKRLVSINQRLIDPAITSDTYSEVLKTKNELVATVEAIKIHIPKVKDFTRSLNEIPSHGI